MPSQQKVRSAFKAIERGPALSAWLPFLLLILFCRGGISQDFQHTVKISDPGLRRELESQGGVLLGDYGAYQIYGMDNLEKGLSRKAGVELRDDFFRIHLNARELDTRQPEMKKARMAAAAKSFTGKQLRLIQFTGPVKSQWLGRITGAGAQIVSYIPQNACLLYTDAAALQKLRGIPTAVFPVQWEGNFEDDFKIHPLARQTDSKGKPRNIGTDFFEIQLFKDGLANSKTLQLLDSLKREAVKPAEEFRNYINLVVRLDPASLPVVAHQPDVVAILPHFEPRLLCERQDQIVAGNLTNGAPAGPGYLAWLASNGFSQSQFDASGILVDVTDSGVDNGTSSPWHFGLYENGIFGGTSRMAYNRLVGTPNYGSTISGCDGHGNINAHIVGGYDDGSGFPFADSAGFHYGLGVCPFVKMGSSVIFDPYYTYPNFTNLVAGARNSGARVSCNSWGFGGTMGVYNSRSQIYDALVRDARPAGSAYYAPGNQEISIVFAAGNDGPGSGTVESPGTAKNVITVGASDGVQPFGGPDGLGITDADASNACQVAFFSSQGPCADGRVKPDILAPGTHISGGVAQLTNDPVHYPWGIANSCYDGSGVAGGTNGSIYWPDGQQFYTACSGTSQSAPCVAGGCALVMQHFLNLGSNFPSAAMVKAFLLNSAGYLNGANDALPSSVQGMGEMNLGQAFDGAHRILRDQLPQDLFTNSGQFCDVTAAIADTNRPLRVTLAWTDAPGSLAGYAYNNDLDLVVRAGTNVYKGNVFSGQYSIPGGNADYKDNVESVFLPPGVSGNIVVTVVAANINSQGVPATNGAPNQDFALVIYNADAVAMPVIIPSAPALAAESCLPANGVIDPGETVTVNFGIQNIGTLPCGNLTVTLATNSHFVTSSNTATLGFVPAGGGMVSFPFTFKALGNCGDTIVANLALTDGTNAVGSFNFPFTLGVLENIPVFSENFDALTPPALPSGWASSATGGQSPWQSSASESDTYPDSMFAADSTNAGVCSLVSPSIFINTTSAQLSFASSFDLESEPAGSAAPTNGDDGGVLDISINNGMWTDILAAGGSFVSGGYTAPIQGGGGNPLQGRMAWTGNSGGFISTVVQLPASAAGQHVQLRWTLGANAANTNGGTGWYVDSVVVTDNVYECCNPLVAPAITNLSVSAGQMVFSFQSVQNQTYSLQTTTNLSAPAWTNILSIGGDGTVLTLTNTTSGGLRFYRLVSP